MAMVPPAPGLFSTTTGWPSVRDSSVPTAREIMSAVLPAASGTSKRIGRAGQLCAMAEPVHKAASAIASRALRRAVIMGELL